MQFHTAPQPHVLLTRDEAEALALALNRARVRLVRATRTVAQSRTLSEADKEREAAPLRADLATLAAFYAAHCQAHGLGGY